MDPKVQTSFIPKKPLVSSQASTSRNATAVNGFGILGVVIFVLSLALAGGVFFWQKISEKQLEANKVTLARQKQQFDPALIEEMKKFSTRIRTARQLLNEHVAVSRMFDALSASTVKSVRFKNIAYTMDNKEVRLGLTGEAKAFTSIALQADEFGANKVFVSPIISNLNLGDNGTINFNFTATMPIDYLLYKNNILLDESSSTAPTEVPAQ